MFINKSKTNLDSFVPNLIVNNKLSAQPIRHLNTTPDLNFGSHHAGLIYETSFTNLILYYNDSAVFSVPYLLNTLSNFNARLNGLKSINASMTPWPQVQTDTAFFNPTSFSTLIILGISLIFPLVSFGAEIVQDREVRF